VYREFLKNIIQALPSENCALGMPAGQHAILSAKIGQELVSGPYTPISQEDDIGGVSFLIKVSGLKIPQRRKMSEHMGNLEIGDQVRISGPHGMITYEGHGNFVVRGEKSSAHHFKHVGMIAYGEGIAAMLQLTRKILKSADDSTTISFLCLTEDGEDVYLKNQLKAFDPQVSKGRFKMVCTAPNEAQQSNTMWKYSVGCVNPEMIRANLPVKEESSVILICGSPEMIHFDCIPSLNKLGFPEENRIIL